MSQPEPLEYGCRAAGKFTNICVIDSRTGEVVRRVPDQQNLILDVGLDEIATQTWASQLTFGAAGTGTADTREAVTGTYSQSGTTVTRDSGSRDFTAADVGKLIKFGSGEESKISAFDDASTVTVVQPRTVSATTITLYHVNQGGLQTEVKRSNTYPSFNFPDGTAAQTTILDPANAKITLRRTYDFTAESGNVTYTEIGVGRVANSAPNGTYAQSGTTVTRSSGSGTFAAGDVGRQIRWASGEVAVITAFTNTTTVTVDRSQSVSAAAIALERLFSRIKLAEPIDLEEDQQLRFTYNLTIQIGGVPGVTEQTVEGNSVGWPVEYGITDIETDGSKMTVTLAENHHYIAGGKVNLVGVVMPRTAITAADSTGTDFTITAPGHSFSPADSIVIQGVTPNDYNGTFTVDSVSGDDITVSSLLDPGTGTLFGTVRLADPTPWYNGEWTVADVPAADKIEITTDIEPPTPELPEGIVRNNVKRKLVSVGYGVRAINPPTTLIDRICTGYIASNNNVYSAGLFDGVSDAQRFLQVYLPGSITDGIPQQPTVFPTVFPAQWQGTTATHLSGSQTSRSDANIRFNTTTTTFANSHRKNVAPSEYINGSFFQDCIYVFNASDFDYSHILFLGMVTAPPTGNGNSLCCQGYFLFEERQRKDSVHKLTLTVRRRWARDLSAEP